VVVTHLEQTTRPSVGVQRAPRPDLAMRRVAAAEAAAEAERFYRAVGAAWHWRDRLVWSAVEWEDALNAPGATLWIASAGDQEIGYVELAPAGTAMEIRYLGLLPEAIGKGYGRWLLEQAVAIAWAAAPSRVILNTCTLDGPAALPNYLARGFVIVREEHQLRELPA
jgi:GNAT superfamily N-acetyltransferase